MIKKNTIKSLSVKFYNKNSISLANKKLKKEEKIQIKSEKHKTFPPTKHL